jgi:hypothetical protein
MLQERQHHDFSNPQQFTQMHICNVSVAKIGSCTGPSALRGHTAWAWVQCARKWTVCSEYL